MRSILKSKNKKGAIELSMTTVVVIVLSMTMLVLGLVLVRSIFTGATELVDITNEKTKAQIIDLFADEESSDLIVLLGSDKTIKVKADTDLAWAAIAARTIDGTASSRDRLQYKLTLDQNSDCLQRNAKAIVESWFSGIGTYRNFDGYEGDTSTATVKFGIPKATALCTQTVNIDVKDVKLNQDVGGKYFIIQVISKGFLG
ncbi:MAG: hypothetical protein KKE23_04260 [Nanoarchaeota archaeon]|nr:hypothetical protein [Nanoarchaeota archaeon]